MRTSSLLIATVAMGALALPASASAQEWTGFYVGVQTSRVETETTNALDITGPITTYMPLGVADAERLLPTDIGDHTDAWGVHLGYLMQRGDWVLGGEIDANEGGDFPFRDQDVYAGRDSATIRYYGAHLESDWAGSVRVRGGWLARPNLMIYGVGGYAMRNLEVSSTTLISIPPAPTFGAFISTAKEDVSGWVLGAGVEWKPVDHWGLRVEYAHTDYGELSVTDPVTGVFSLIPVVQGDGRYTSSLSQDEVRLGVSYHF